MWNTGHGKHFSKRRREAGFNQFELAEAMGYRTKQPIYFVESGRQNPSPAFRTQALRVFKEILGESLTMADIFLDIVVDKEKQISA